MPQVTPENGEVDAPSPNQQAQIDFETPEERKYAIYVLFVLSLVYLLNYLDRQLLAIVAEDVKADLKISDADLGFLFGTAFAVFYAIFGIPLGRLADVWSRKKVISAGITFWSLMTALSGLTRSFLPLAACRFGVGIGEASATPAAGSLLYDYFPPKVRTTVFSIYQCGNFVGGGLGIFLGGLILDTWNSTWPDPSAAPFGLHGWQATFLLVGLPGILLALWVSTLREPVRGRFDGRSESKSDETNPKQIAAEARETFLSTLPICSWFVMIKKGGGWKSIALNIVIAGMITIAGTGATWLTGDKLQWITIGIGLYCVSSWTQVLALRDRQAFETIFRSPTLLCLYIGGSAIVFKTVITFWCVPYFQRAFGLEASEVGTTLGLGGMVLGLTGLILGGVIADKLRLKSVRGKLYVIIGGLASAVVAALTLLLTSNVHVAYAAALSIYMFGAVGMGPAVSTAADLALPRVRGTAVAFYIMSTSLIGTALGPYVIGQVSDAIAATGVDSAESLRQGMLWGLTMPIVGILALVTGLRFVDRDTARVREQTLAAE